MMMMISSPAGHGQKTRLIRTDTAGAATFGCGLWQPPKDSADRSRQGGGGAELVGGGAADLKVDKRIDQRINNILGERQPSNHQPHLGRFHVICSSAACHESRSRCVSSPGNRSESKVIGPEAKLLPNVCRGSHRD